MYSSRNNILIGFHGCDESVSEKLINNPNEIKFNINPHDWLGNGFYIWENNYARALQWAEEKEKRGEIKKASVVGAVVSLERCFDLIDSEFIDMLTVYHSLMLAEFEGDVNKTMPENKNKPNDPNNDKLARKLDCAVIEYMHGKIKEVRKIKEFDTARGVFTEGGPAFPGAGIQKKSHIQICVRNFDCIKGFFKPRQKEKKSKKIKKSL